MEVNDNMGNGSISKEEAIRREKLFLQGIKVCSKCKQELPFGMFTSDITTKTGLSSSCKNCQKEQRKQRKPKIDKWFEENKDRVNEYQREYSKEHAEEKKAYNNVNKEYFKQKRKEYEQQNIEKIREQRQRYRHSLSARYKKYQVGAKERNLIFDLSMEEFKKITQQPCLYCGEFSGEHNGIKYNGVDRIDSSDGYTTLNCIPCCEMCNRMKSNYDMIFWLNHIKKIADRLMSDIEEEINYGT